MISTSYENSRDFLIYSNLAYLLPIAVLLYKILYKKHFPKRVGFELALIYVAVMYFSINYHICRSEIAKKDSDINQYQTELPENNIKQSCEIGGGMVLDKATLLDHIFAFYAISITMLYLIPLDPYTRHLIQSSLLIFIIVLQSYNELPYDDIITAIPTLLVAIYFSYYLISSKTKKSNYYFVLSGALLSIAAVMLFMLYPEPYWLNHSLWHILGALSGALLLFPKY